jgi:pyruvate dehydrogenase E1 component beta subunit
MLEKIGIQAEIVDVISVQPLNLEPILDSLRKTRKLIISDTGQIEFGVSAEVLSRITESGFSDYAHPPVRIGLPFSPTPTAPTLSADFYPRSIDIARTAARMCGKNPALVEDSYLAEHLDVPNQLFKGPY